jgi:hypothetical protein
MGHVAVGAARYLKSQRRRTIGRHVAENLVQSLVICPVFVKGNDTDADGLAVRSAIILGRT